MNRFLPRMSPVLIAWITLTLLHGRAFATDRYFSDIAATSSNGRFHLTAKSPDNELQKRPAFQSGFILTLADTSNGNVLWTQPCPKGSAAWIRVNDDSSVVVYTGNLVFVALEAVTGRTVASASIYQLLPADDFRNGHVAHSSVGPLWQQNSLYSFFEHDGSTYFGCKTGWDHVFVLDFAGHRAITSPSNRLVQAFDRALGTRALDTLKIAAANPSAAVNENLYDISFEIMQATDIVGRLQLRDAIPSLRTLELLEPPCDDRLPVVDAAAVTPEIRLRPFALRQWVRTALRRLGELPKPLPCSYVVEDWWGPATARIAVPIDRAAGVKSLPDRVARHDLLLALGPPDAIPEARGDEMRWQFEIDGLDETWILEASFHFPSDEGTWKRLKSTAELLLVPNERAGDIF